MHASQRRRFTPEEYLLVENQAEYKSEYYDGEIYAMAGASYRHTEIVGNLFAYFRQALKGSDCKPLMLDVRVKSWQAYTYPDIVIVCGPPQFTDEYDTLTNPTLIVEVLSDSTEKTDRTIKFERYKTIESLQEYLLVAQNEPGFELFRRADAGWIQTASSDSVTLASLNIKLERAAAYEDISF